MENFLRKPLFRTATCPVCCMMELAMLVITFLAFLVHNQYSESRKEEQCECIGIWKLLPEHHHNINESHTLGRAWILRHCLTSLWGRSSDLRKFGSGRIKTSYKNSWCGWIWLDSVPQRLIWLLVHVEIKYCSLVLADVKKGNENINGRPGVMSVKRRNSK